MYENKSVASLSPSLLARKGGARPAMRSQFQPIVPVQDAAAWQLDDLGFNDLGEDFPAPQQQGEVVSLKSGAVTAPNSEPEVRRQQAQIAKQLKPNRKPRRSALSEGRSAAFTLRLDADRHLALRLACTLSGRSAQQLVIEALDQMIAQTPEVADLATRANSRRAKS